MPGDSLVDGEQPEHARVVLAQVRLLALLRPVLGDRGDREEGLLVAVERAGGIEHRPAEGTHEGRRPADVERFVGQPDQVALAAERLDPLELLPAEIEQLLGRRVVGGDRVEDAADQPLLVGGRFGAREPGRPQLRGDPDHLGADGAVVALRLFEDPLGRQVVGAHRVAHLLGEQRGAQPSVALAPRQHLVAEVALEAVHLCARTLGGRAQPWQHGGDGRILAFRLLRRRERLFGELDDARQLLERLLGVEACHRTLPDRPDLLDRGIDHRLEAVEPSRDRGEPLRQRREFPGDESEQPAAEEVDPLERVPGFLAQIQVREAHRVQLLDEQIAVDGVVVGQVREPAELRQPAVCEGDPLAPSGRRHVGPQRVVRVLADHASRRSAGAPGTRTGTRRCARGSRSREPRRDARAVVRV